MIDILTGIAIAGFLGTVGGAGGAWGATRQRIRATEVATTALGSKLDDHDKRTSGFSDRLARIETDISWIRRTLETTSADRGPRDITSGTRGRDN